MNPLVTTGQDRRRDVTALSVNVNKIALLRNQRPLAIPSVVGLARIALEAGAHGITVHPRPDERHIRAGDVRELAALLKDWPDAELNIEGNPYQNLMPLVRELRPHQCTFVPDDAAQATSDHGWDLAGDDGRLAPLVAEARSLGIRVSLFMDADPGAMAKAQAIGADRVELYTEPYAQAWGTPTPGSDARRLQRRRASRAAPRPRRQRRPRSQPRQPRRLPRRRPGRPRGLDRPRLRRRRARARHGRGGSRLPSRHRVGGVGLVIVALSLVRR